MPATKRSDGESRRRDAARLRVTTYEQLAARKKLPTAEAAARLHGFTRTELFDYKAGRRTPGLARAMRMAADLGTTVEKLFEFTRDGAGRG